MFPRVLVLLATAALALAVCETSDNSPWSGDCYAAADALSGLGDRACCQTNRDGYGSSSGCTTMMTRGNCRVAVCGGLQSCRPCRDMGTYTRDLVNACKNDAIGKIGGKSNNFGDLHIEVWRS